MAKRVFRCSSRASARIGSLPSLTRHGGTRAPAGELKHLAGIAGNIREPDVNGAGRVARVRFLDQLLTSAGRSLHREGGEIDRIVQFGKKPEPDFVPRGHVAARSIVCAEFAALEESEMTDVVRRVVMPRCRERLLARRGQRCSLREDYAERRVRAVVAFTPHAEMTGEAIAERVPAPVVRLNRESDSRRAARVRRATHEAAELLAQTAGHDRELTACTRYIDDAEAATATVGAAHRHPVRAEQTIHQRQRAIDERETELVERRDRNRDL